MTRKPDEEEKAELQWVENLIDNFIAIGAEIAVGVVMTIVAAGTWLADLWVGPPDPPTPPSAE